MVENVLRVTAEAQFKNKTLLTEEELSKPLEKYKLKRTQISELFAKMISDDLIQFLADGTKIGFTSQILCNYWNYTFIDTSFWYDA